MEDYKNENIENTLNSILSIDRKNLYKEDDKHLSLKKDKEWIEEIFQILEEFKDNYIVFLKKENDTNITYIEQRLSTLEDMLTNLVRLNINEINSKKNRINDLKNSYRENRNTYLNEFENFLLKKKLKNETKNEIEKELKETRKIKESVLGYKREIEELKKSVKITASETGNLKFGEIFKEKSENYDVLAKEIFNWWFCLIIFILIISLLGFNFYYINSSKNLNQNLYFYIFTNIFSTLIIFYYLNFNIRKYYSFTHLSKIYDFKQNCLNTFETFTKSVEDKETKIAILLQTINTIFETPNTGFIKKEDKSQEKINIQELIKEILRNNNQN